MKKFDFCSLGTDPAYRSMPFWAWNDQITPAEVRRQVRIMHEMHMGGFFIHSRAGLATEYLGREWFDCVNAAVDEAGKLGMLASLYDEDRWPSGAAGGMITQEKKFRMRYLEFYDATEPLPCGKEDILLEKLFILELDAAGNVAAYRSAGENETAAANEKAVRIIVRIAPSAGAYNNGSYLDTTNPEAVQAFIESTHEKYLAECGDKFGKSIPYFFTDEPNYLDIAAAHRRPWSDRLPELFTAETGMVLADVLPELFWNCGRDFSSVRYFYYRLLTGLFTDTFMKMLGEWCKKHHIALTGHLLREDTLSQQIHSIGAAMPGYEYMQAPGIDVLTANWIVLNTVKQLASVARQLDKKHLLSESYGCTGWDFPLAGHKAVGDWQYALGINLRCQHLYWYSMRGGSKRDYPASIGGQSPWYKVHAPLEKYFARLGELFAQTGSQADLLVIHPIETMWGYAAEYDKKMSFNAGYDRKFDWLARELIGNHIEFDYGDESLLSKYGKVADGIFSVGWADYHRVLIPEVETLRSSTVELLKEFVRQGGKVCYLGKTPCRIDGKIDSAGILLELYKAFEPFADDEISRYLRKGSGCCSAVDASGKEAQSVILRYGVLNPDAAVLFAVNTGTVFEDQQQVSWLEERTAAYCNLQIKVPVTADKRIYQMDIFSGDLTPVEFELQDGYGVFYTDLGALESRCFIAGNAEVLPEAVVHPHFTGRKAVIHQEMPAVLSEENLLVLDHASAYSGNELLCDNEYILKIDNQLRTLHGLMVRGNQRPQPWFAGNDHRETFPAAVEFEFFCENIPEDDLYIVMENPEVFTILINGVSINNHSCGCWCDQALERVLLKRDMLSAGKNVLRLELEYNSGFSGLEAVYLTGNFGVKNLCYITAIPPEIHAGCSTVDCGLPYYGGNITYNMEFELGCAGYCQTMLPQWSGSALGISWDAGEEKIFYTLEGIESPVEYLAAGKHTLQVTVYGHRRNCFGPFYCQERSSWVGPYEFSLTQLPEKSLVSLGLLKQPEIYLLEQ